MKKKLKLLIIRSSEDSTWGSCRVISPNLQATYKLMENEFDLEWFDIPLRYIPSGTSEEKTTILDLVEKIKSNKYDRIVSLDHLPIQPSIFLSLIRVMPRTQLPPIVFHIYGDFTYFASEWRIFGQKFAGHPVRFIVASKSQKRLMRCFGIKDDDIKVGFFPVKPSEFSYSAELRKELRKEQAVSDETFVVTYAGRISLQKNVDVLIKLLNREALAIDKNIELWIVGAFDDQGANFAGVFTYEGYLFSKIHALVEKTKNIKIKFFGNQKKKEIRRIMCASDAYASLSLYHDEDYGMSPAEALACGLPSLLTDWGGYSSFVSKEGRWECSLMDVDINEYGHILNRTDLRDFLLKTIDSKFDDQDREKFSKSFLEKFAVESAVKGLRQNLADDVGEFHGFSWKMEFLRRAYNNKQTAKKEVNLDLTPSIDNLYYEIYNNYISKKHEETP